jgi:hypothetical protein
MMAVMKKILFVLMALLCFSSLSNAQRFSVGGGLTLYSPGGAGLSFGLSGNVAALDIFTVGNFGFDARGTFDVDFGSGLGITLSAFARLWLRQFELYAGPTLGILFGRGVGVGATLGIRTPGNVPFGFFGELEFLSSPAALRLRAGINFLI